MVGMPLWRLCSRAGWPSARATGALAWCLLALGGLGQLLLASSVVPSAPLLGRLLLGVLATSLGLAVVVGTLALGAGAVGRLRDDGAWVALQAAGVGRWPVAWRLGALSLPGVGLSLLLAHVGEPTARAALRDTRAQAAASVAPRAGETVRLAGWWLAVDGGRLHFTDGLVTGSAGGWLLQARQGGVLAALQEVEVRTEGAIARAESVALPLGLREGKVHVSERTTPDLLRQLRVSAALGRDGYERWQLYKRTLLPLALLPLAVGVAGAARRHPPGAVVAAALFGSWLAVRLFDASLGPREPALAAGAFGSAVLVLAVLSWRR